jgi:hypothetical protein
MFIWLVLAWGYGSILARRVAAFAPTPRRRVGAVTLTLAGTALATVGTALAEGPDLSQREYRPIRSLTSQVLARLPKRPTVGLERITLSDTAYNYEAALAYALRRAGERVVSADLAVLLSSWYAPGPARPAMTLDIVQGNGGGPRVLGSVVDGSGGRVRVLLIRRG